MKNSRSIGHLIFDRESYRHNGIAVTEFTSGYKDSLERKDGAQRMSAMVSGKRAFSMKCAAFGCAAGLTHSSR
jgi:hypothetical protein